MLVVAVLLLSLSPRECSGYSVLTHEALVDLAWNSSIEPLLLSRFPSATKAQLQKAHAFAYGGSAIQDMGYYPFGKQFFSDLTHYVRSGDFVASLFRNARTVDEYAFAIGALSHYLGDSIGHATVINEATAVEFKKLRRRYGPIVTYEQDPHAHVRTEFAFDIDQISKHRFPPRSYLERIGFQVPRRQLERAFEETYGLRLHDILGPEFSAIKSYRWSVRHFIPWFAGAEVVIHRHHFPPDASDDGYQEYALRISETAYKLNPVYIDHGPGIGPHLLAPLVRIVPKVGVFSLLGIKGPTEQTEAWYIRSVTRTVDTLGGVLGILAEDPETKLRLADLDLDTGARVRPGSYQRTDETYAKLLHILVSHPDNLVRPSLRRDILNYYADPSAPIATKRNAKQWKQVLSELEILKRMKTVSAPEAPSH